MVQGIKAENQLKFHIINSPDKKTLQGNIFKNVETGSGITTDEFFGYRSLLMRIKTIFYYRISSRYC